MKLTSLLPVIAVSALLAACQTTSAAPGRGALSPEDEVEERSSYGAFLAGRFAGTSRDAQSSSDYYNSALAREPQSAILAERTFVSALISGDESATHEAALGAISGDSANNLARLYLAAEAIGNGQYEYGHQILDGQNLGSFNDFIGELLGDWITVGRGDIDGALVRAEATSVPGYAAAFLTLHRALLADYADEAILADAAYRAAISESPFTRIAIDLYGDFLLRERRRDEAIDLYQAYLAGQPGERSISFALERAENTRRRPRDPEIAEMAARSIFGPAAALAQQADMDLSVIYLRLSNQLDPEYGPAALLLGTTLERVDLEETAITAFEAVPEGPFRLSADIDRLWLQARRAGAEASLAEAEELAAGGELEARLLYADLLRSAERYEPAIDLYAEATAEIVSQGRIPDWRYYYFRAIALEQSGRWQEAEADFLSALEIAPNEPEVLNYLGYMWVIQGQNIEEAFEMIERAARLQPEAGHIIDSLGWAHYVRGNYQLAVFHLEQAAALSPGAPTINYHLGDAYWQVGRELEARFQWERALTLEPDEDERIGLLARLNGEPPEAPATALVVNDTP